MDKKIFIILTLHVFCINLHPEHFYLIKDYCFDAFLATSKMQSTLKE